MISIMTKNLREGMVTAQGIYNSRGAAYLVKGSKLNQQYINRLRDIGIKRVAVTSMDTLHPAPPAPDDIVQERTRIGAIQRVYNVFQKATELSDTVIEPLFESTDAIVMDVLSRHENLVQMTDIRLHDDYTFAHSVSVSILSTMLGWLCGFDKKDLMTLALGGMLHDVGKISIPSDVLNKPSSLNDAEFDMIRHHPIVGRERLSHLHIPQASLISAIAYEHHEHMNGRGYPRHIKGNAINLFARIAEVADVYDALTSERSYKRSYKPHTAYKIMTKLSPGQFDEDLLQLFFQNVAIFPVGTVMKTKLGYTIVKEVTPGQTQAPVVCLFANEKQQPLETPRIVLLSNFPSSVIESVLDDQELLILSYRMHMDPATLLTDDGITE